MNEADTNSEQSAKIGRRSFIARTLAAVSAAAAPGQSRDYGRDAPPVRYPDRDVVVLDPRSARYRIDNTPIQRLYTGELWAEGPTWNGLGRFLICSDIPNNVVHRRLEEDGHVRAFRRHYEANKGDLLIKEAVYRIDVKTGKVEMVAGELKKPNGVCFSHNY